MNNNGFNSFQFYNNNNNMNYYSNLHFQNPQMNIIMLQYMMNIISQNNQQNQLNSNFQIGYNKPYTLNDVQKTNKNIITKKINKYKKELNFNKSNNKNITKSNIPKRKLTKEEKVEIEKWVLARKKNFPTKSNIEEKEKNGKRKEDIGMISKLELKLRKKVNLLKRIDGKKKVRNNKNKNCKHNIIKTNNFNFKNDENVSINNNNIIEKTIELEEGEIENECENENKIQQNKMNNNSIKNLDKIENDKIDSLIQNKRERKKRNNNKSKMRFPFSYKHNFLFDNMIKKEIIQEQNIILQAFRYFINEKLV